MGRYRSPCCSFSKTIGLLDGISTRTPPTPHRRTGAPPAHVPRPIRGPVWTPGPLSEPNPSSCQTTPVIARKPSAAPGLPRTHQVVYLDPVYPNRGAVTPVPP